MVIRGRAPLARTERAADAIRPSQETTIRIDKTFALALAIAAMSAGLARASGVPGLGGEAFNAFEPLPPSSMTGGATSFTIVFAGNVVSAIDTAGTVNDTGLNPFAYVNSLLNNGGTTSVTAALDGNGNTDVTFMGSNAIMSSSSFQFGNNLPHVGLSSSPSGPASLDLLSQTWSNSSSSFTLPGGVSVSVVNGGATDPFAIFFAQVTSGRLTSGEWFELPYTAGTVPRLTLANYTSSAETLSDAGYYLSPTQIPLDDLNFGSNSPPGSLNSPFIPLPNLGGQTLSPGNGTGGAGGSITTQGLVPEPSSIISMATGLLIAAGYFGSKRSAIRRGRTAPIA
jgi:hypothetical protein